MAFTAADVKNLRERTGCGMMDCKKALTETNGDMDKAIEFLREKGLAAAAKKAGRIAADGLVVAVTDSAKKAGVVLEVNAETDFVAKNEKFVEFVNDVAKVIIDTNPADVDDLLTKKCSTGLTVQDELTEKIQTIGENMKIRRFVRMEGVLVPYVHGNGRIGVLVKFDTDLADKEGFTDYGKDIAMQIAAVSPEFLDEHSIPADRVEKEKEILTVQAMNEGKPANIAEKMVAGRIKKFFKEICLVDQIFVKDNEKTISEYTADTAKKLSGSIKIADFARFEKGEGLEKKEENFADEIAKMVH